MMMPNNEKICFVQFPHPGAEHKPDKNNPDFIDWNRGDHKRKFLKQKGDYIDNKDNKIENKDIMFWGEWEPQSSVIKIDNPEQDGQYPKYIYKPYYRLDDVNKGNIKKTDFSRNCKGGKLQNTDPFVFGGRFLYGICKQYRKTGSTKLNCLEHGSVIVFGSCKEQRFVVDTVFVVGKYIDYEPTMDGLKNLKNELLKEQFNLPEDYINKYFKISLYRFIESLEPTKGKKSDKYRLYIGATYDNPHNNMFSFFPCLSYKEDTKGFPRPTTGIENEKSIDGNRVISPECQSFLSTPSDKIYIKKLWEKLRDEILNQDQGLMLGIRADMPPSEKPA